MDLKQRQFDALVHERHGARHDTDDSKVKKALFAQTQQAGFDSVGAYLRRKASAPDTLDAAGLHTLLDAVRESTARANASRDQALAEFAQYKAWKQARRLQAGRMRGKPEQPGKHP